MEYKMEKKTPLYDVHVALGGKIVPFAGYLLPVQYGTGVITEHMAVRKEAGLFDVSHMAELVLEGKDALANVNMLTTVHVEEMTDGQVKYSPMCNEQGGIVDDLMVYRMGAEKYLLVVNAANHEKDYEWIKAHLFGEVTLTDISEGIAQIALQGPASEKILKKICEDKDIPEKYYYFIPDVTLKTNKGDISDVIVSRTGYTGEAGFELYCKAEDAEALFMTLLEVGKEDGLIPCGLGARDTLRLEASMPLYGHEMNDEISPKEASLGFFVKLDKENFIGKDAIIARGDPKIKRVGIEITGRGIARENCKIFKDGEEIGWVSSGTHCPFLGRAVAMGYVKVEFAAVDTTLQIDVRGRTVEGKIIKLPFIKKEK